MDAQVLGQRLKMLQEEAVKAKQNVISLSEQLEQAKSHFSTVSGHLNESAYIMGELNKVSDKTSQSVIDSLNHADTDGVLPENKLIEADQEQI